MKNSKKKSPAKSKKKSKKNPLRKYQLAGQTAPPTLGSSNAYSGFDQGLDYQGFDANFTPTSGSIAGAASGIGSAVMAGMQDTSVDDPQGYFNKSTLDRIEKSRRGARDSGIASGVGQTMMSIAPSTGLASPFVFAAGALTTAGGEIGKAVHKGKEKRSIGDYDKLFADRQRYKERQDQKRQENLDRNAATNYYDQGSGLAAKYGGMREYQAGGLNQEVPLEEEMNVMDPAMNVLRNGGIRKYMGGGYQKVTGPSHEDGGIAMDLSGDGVNDAELEGGEIIEEMKHGGNAPKKYIWSDHLKTGGMSFAKKFEKLRKGGARPGDVETLRIEQEIAAKRDPSKLYAKYGGLPKYQNAGVPQTQYVGLDSAEVSNLQKYKASGMSTQDAMRRATLGEDDLTRRLSGLSSPQPIQAEKLMIDRADMRNERLSRFNESQRETQLNRASFESNRRTPIVLPMKSAIDPDLKRMRDSVDFKNGGLMKYTKGGVSRTGAGKFFAEYGAPMANVAGEAVNIGMNLSQKYNPVETVNARELTADKIYIDRAKDKQAGFRESELMGAKRASRATTGTGATQRENALRMTSLRAGEMAAQNIYDQNRQASTAEQKVNLDAQMRVDEANRQTDLVESESRRGEGLRKESFENMRKKYIGSVAGQLGNELASGMYRKEYINATLPDGVNQYALKPKAISDQMKKINPETKKKYTYADAINAVLIQYNLENP